MGNRINTVPENRAQGVVEDTELTICGFDKEPVPDPEGRVLIMDGKETADVIRFSDETVTLGGDGAPRQTFNVGSQLVRTEPMEEGGAWALHIKPHPGVLKPGKTYSVIIESGVVAGTLDGAGFAGFTEENPWTFSTRKEVPLIEGEVLFVAQTPGITHSKTSAQTPDTIPSYTNVIHFSSIQGALDHAQSRDNAARDYVIKVSPGTYHELLYYAGSGTITLSGQSQAGSGEAPDYSKGEGPVEVKYANAGVMNPSEDTRNLFTIMSGSFVVENMGFENTYSREENPSGSQSEVLGMNSGKGTFAAYNCFFKGHQDTIRTQGKAWFYGCFISGDTDFLWTESENDVLVVENCNLVAVYDRFKKPGSHYAYITAPRMDIGERAGKGIVVMDCNVTIEKGMTAYLGRTPWKSGYYNQAAFINNTFFGEEGSGFICDWKNAATEETMEKDDGKNLGWKQYGNRGRGHEVKTSALGFSAILDEEFVNEEYSSRDAVINRVYSFPEGSWIEDDRNPWDIDSLIARMGWEC